MRDVSPVVDGFEVAVDGVHRAAGDAGAAARELDVAADALRALALAPDEVGPRGAALATAVAGFAERSADRLEAAGWSCPWATPPLPAMSP